MHRRREAARRRLRKCVLHREGGAVMDRSQSPNHRRGVPAMMVRRRTTAEQRALRMIRGEDDASPVSSLHHAQFGKLRARAERNGFQIQAASVPYLGSDELRLLGWLAEAQRVASYARSFHPDAMLSMMLVHCAGTLDALGIRLPAHAMHRAPAFLIGEREPSQSRSVDERQPSFR